MRKLTGFWNKIVLLMSIALVVFHMYTSGVGLFPDIVQRSVHLFFVLSLCFILKPATKKAPKDRVPIYDIIFAIIAAASCVYMFINYEKVLWEPIQWLDPLDQFFAISMTLLILEASRRSVGWTFPIMGIIFGIYAYFGPYFPGVWGHQKFTVDYIFQNFYHSTSGIWGTMVGISATMLAMFGIFGAVLSATGGSQTFIKLGQIVTGKTSGGSGKVALIASGLFGMISGSAMANVVATGTFTIPLMKDSGYDNEWSAAVSAVGSTGGQIMPPIMGAGAFVMAQLIGVPYIDIAIAAIFPALLYYIGAFVAVHYIAVKNNIRGQKFEEKIKMSEYIIIGVPLVVFVAFLCRAYAVTYAAFFGTIMGIVTCFLVYWFRKKDIKSAVKETGKLSENICLSSSASILDMASLLAGAQITITLISLTGFGVKMSNLIVSLGQNSLFLCLVLSMFVCIILGMGLPTTAAYVLAASVLAPALISLGLPTMIAHLFVFYFSTMATITPPVCAAVFLSAGIAGANWLKTGFLSILLALPAFVVPYTFAYNQDLLLMGDVVNVIISCVTALLGVSVIGMSIAGYIKRSLNWPNRILFFVAGLCLLIPNVIVSIIGLVIAIIIYCFNGEFGNKSRNKIQAEN